MFKLSNSSQMKMFIPDRETGTLSVELHLFFSSSKTNPQIIFFILIEIRFVSREMHFFQDFPSLWSS